jgi:hypothetical protein
MAMEHRKRALPVKQCGATTRAGAECRKSAGWNTPHLGVGRCSLHGGCTPDHVKHAARQEAMEFVVGALGHEMDIDPLDAALMAVRLAAGSTAFWRYQLADAQAKGEELTSMQIEGYRMALTDLSRISKSAIDAGVVEKLAQINERMAEQIVLAAEEALAAIQLDVEQRTIFAQRFAEALARLEGEPIEGQAKQLGT